MQARALQQATAVGTSALGSAAHIRTRAPNHTPSTSADAIHTTPVIDVEEHSSDIGDDSDQGGLTDMDEQEASEAGADDHLRVSSPGIDRAGLCGMGDAGTVFENDGLEDKEAEHIEDAPSTSITHAEVAGVHPQPSTSTAHPVRLSSSPPIPILAGFNKHAAHATASAHGIRAEQAALSESLEEQLSPAAHAAASSLNAVTWAVAGAVAVPSPFASSAVGAAAHAGSAGGASQRLPSSWENASSLMAAAAGPGASVSTARHTLMHEGRVQCMRVSPGGGLYVCSCSDDGSAAIWPALSTAHTAAGEAYPSSHCTQGATDVAALCSGSMLPANTVG